MISTVRGGALTFLLCAGVASAQSVEQAGPDGRLLSFAKWEPIELSFQGPVTSETASAARCRLSTIGPRVTSTSSSAAAVAGGEQADGELGAALNVMACQAFLARYQYWIHLASPPFAMQGLSPCGDTSPSARSASASP